MFNEAAMVSMSNGQKKNINLIRPGEYILNKFKHPTKVIRIHQVKDQNVIEIQLDNGTNKFSMTPDTRVFSHFSTQDGVHSTSYCSISTAHEKDGFLKKSIRPFSPESDVKITSYTESAITEDVYCLHTSDSSQSFMVNDIIVLCQLN